MYRFNYTIKEEDINYGGHVGNERALLFFQISRMSLFESLGFSELDIGDNIGIIQKKSYVEYNKELFLDEKIEVIIDKFLYTKASFTLFYKILSDGEIAIEGYTQLIAFDYANKKMKRIPNEFIKKMNILFANQVS
ncbi:MAG: acyl-CoA thioesterase [Fusobacteriaceae bacterium]|jgi:acyl-CoA thioester hydrolase|nr:acyl-CoA thioesterase [Fusobacteriaceae bacterium]